MDLIKKIFETDTLRVFSTLVLIVLTARRISTRDKNLSVLKKQINNNDLRAEYKEDGDDDGDKYIVHITQMRRRRPVRRK